MKASRGLVIAALCIAGLLLVQGIVGLVLPARFVAIVAFVQTSPVIYAAAAFRVAVGCVLLAVASSSRLPKFLRIFGALVLLGGVLTPFFGFQFAERILGWWSSQGANLVRVFASASLILGFLIAYAVAPASRNA